MSNNDIAISGPIGTLRLEGKIGNIKKVIYLFADIHKNINSQTECDTLFSKDIHEYFRDSFASLDKNKFYDFILEDFPNKIKSVYNQTFVDIYILELRKFMLRSKNYDNDNNVMNMSTIFKNIRFHYADIRFFINLIDVDDDFYNTVYPIPVQFDMLTTIRSFDRIKSKINNIISTFETYQQYKFVMFNDIDVHNPEEFDKARNNIIYKMREKYKHADIKNKLNQYFEKIISLLKTLPDNIDLLIEKINIYNNTYPVDSEIYEYYASPLLSLDESFKNDEFLKEITDGSQNYLYSRRIAHDAVDDLSSYILKKIIRINLKIMDGYTLRRVLDKDYITNAIIYTGAAHTANMIRVLCSEFNFKITHTTYNKSSIADLNKQIIKRVKEGRGIDDIIFSPKIYQCVNLSTFPKNFE
jgi:hypothetical protein